MEFGTDFSSIYSENERVTLPPLNCRVPDSGFDEINCGGVSSFGPPSGAETAAHEYIKIDTFTKIKAIIIFLNNLKLYFSLDLENLNLQEFHYLLSSQSHLSLQ